MALFWTQLHSTAFQSFVQVTTHEMEFAVLAKQEAILTRTLEYAFQIIALNTLI